ncbi:MAG: phosphate signaling complex protein PhoU [Bacteroidota bacterium]|nr:phosphate signaling complex protein PhoU [Bacteroidota bacterium]
MIQIDKEKKMLKDELNEMWTLVNNQIEKAKLALLDFDKNAASEVRSNEKRVDAFELTLDRDSESVILLQNPVAIDLRFIVATLKINYNLERIGDYANKIAKVVYKKDEEFDATILKELKVAEIFENVQDMLQEGLDAFQNDDKAEMLSLFDKDSKLDKLYADAYDATVEYGMNHPEKMADLLRTITSLKMLERAGDHLLNIAEEFVFYKDAEIIKHARLRKDDQNPV